jgi:hypothetical protein
VVESPGTSIRCVTGEIEEILFSNQCIICVSERRYFDPRVKLDLFKQPNWSAYGTEYNAESYSRRCRRKFVEEYENNEIRSSPSSLPLKRPYSAIDNEDDEWEQVVQSLDKSKSANEYDRYISSPLVKHKISVLE